MKVHGPLASTWRKAFHCAQFSQTAQDLHTLDWNAMSPVSKLFFSQKIWFIEDSTLIFCMLSEVDSKKKYMMMCPRVSPLCYSHTCGDRCPLPQIVGKCQKVPGIFVMGFYMILEAFGVFSMSNMVAVPPESKVLESRSATWEYSPSLFLRGWKPNSEIFVANCFGNGGNTNSETRELVSFCWTRYPFIRHLDLSKNCIKDAPWRLVVLVGFSYEAYAYQDIGSISSLRHVLSLNLSHSLTCVGCNPGWWCFLEILS